MVEDDWPLTPSLVAHCTYQSIKGPSHANRPITLFLPHTNHWHRIKATQHIVTSINVIFYITEQLMFCWCENSFLNQLILQPCFLRFGMLWKKLISAHLFSSFKQKENISNVGILLLFVTCSPWSWWQQHVQKKKKKSFIL